MTTDMISITEFKNDATSWLERLQHQPALVLTQNGRGRAVVQSYKSWQQQRFAMALLERVIRGQLDAAAGRTTAHQQVADEVFALIDEVAARKATPAAGVPATRGSAKAAPKRRRRG